MLLKLVRPESSGCDSVILKKKDEIESIRGGRCCCHCIDSGGEFNLEYLPGGRDVR